MSHPPRPQPAPPVRQRSRPSEKLRIDTAQRARFYGANEEGARRGILFSGISEKFFPRLRQSFASATSQRAAARAGRPIPVSQIRYFHQRPAPSPGYSDGDT